MARELRARHLSSARQQQAAGSLPCSRARVPEPSASLPVTGVAFFRTSEAETRAILDADPAEQAGLIASRDLGFVCPRGTWLTAGARGRTGRCTGDVAEHLDEYGKRDFALAQGIAPEWCVAVGDSRSDPAALRRRRDEHRLQRRAGGSRPSRPTSSTPAT